MKPNDSRHLLRPLHHLITVTGCIALEMLFQILSKGPFTCIKCGSGQEEALYRVYGSKKAPANLIPAQVTHLTLTVCSNCGNSIDNYIELDDSIICLDAVLQKSSFYRHCLLNCQLKCATAAKLFILFVLCDSLYIVNQVPRSSLANVNGNYLLFEIIFYSSLLISLLENILLYSILILLFNLVIVCFSCSFRDVKLNSYLLKCFIFSSYYKVFNVIIVLWSSEFQYLVDLMVALLQIVSLAQCIRVIYKSRGYKVSLISAFVIAMTSKFVSQTVIFLLWKSVFQFFIDLPLRAYLARHVTFYSRFSLSSWPIFR